MGGAGRVAGDNEELFKADDAAVGSNLNRPLKAAPTPGQMTDKDKTWTEKGIEDSAEGKANEFKGKIKDAAGSLTGDTSLEAEGKIDQLKGKAQDTLGKLEREIDE